MNACFRPQAEVDAAAWHVCSRPRSCRRRNGSLVRATWILNQAPRASRCPWLQLDFANAPPARLATPADLCLLADLGHWRLCAGVGRRGGGCACGPSLARAAAPSPRRRFRLARRLGRIRSARCCRRVSERRRGHACERVSVHPYWSRSALLGQRARPSLAVSRRPSTTSSTDDLKTPLLSAASRVR